MTIRAVLACDGDWRPGDPCRQAIPVGIAANAQSARRTAATVGGWSTSVDWTTTPPITRDLCPACSKRRLEALIPKPRINPTETQIKVIE